MGGAQKSRLKEQQLKSKVSCGSYIEVLKRGFPAINGATGGYLGAATVRHAFFSLPTTFNTFSLTDARILPHQMRSSVFKILLLQERI